MSKKDDFENKFPNITNHQSVVIPLIYVEKYCIEKQKVIEAIGDVINHGSERERTIKKYLFETLGLIELIKCMNRQCPFYHRNAKEYCSNSCYKLCEVQL